MEKPIPWGELRLIGIWKQPRVPYAKGRYVIFDEQVHKVIASTHTHLQLDGIEFAVPAWQCKPQDYALKTKKPKTQSSVETEQEGISA